ncbi:MAG: C25 family cysteine peptidase [Lentimicrobium sp.]|nr:C25 family cysteine peptidase [Lentimicrobium sp.]MEA5109195.1 C25 family cysteine peptidase [Lentimicrobium sp.]
MKKSLQQLLSTGLLAVILLTGQFSFAQVVLNATRANGITLEENAFQGIRVKNSFSSFDFFDVNTDEGLFTEISANGYTFTWEEGSPKLPVMRRLIEIPAGAVPEVRVISYDVREYSLSDFGIFHPLMPTQPGVAKSHQGRIDFVINRDAYQKNNFQKNTLARVEEIGTMRNTRVARLEIAPVEYNPVQGTIRVYDNVVVDIQFAGADYAAATELYSKTRSPFYSGFSFLNPLPKGSSQRENLTRYPVKMVIVSDPMFQATLQPYIQWKTRKGFTMIEAYTNDPAVGTTTASIKSYLQNLYNSATPDDPAPSFVLFVGDVAQIPAYSQGGHVTDLYYCEYTNDILPEVYYGRFSATSVAQLQPQIDKTLMYEQYLFPDPSFLGESLMVSGVDGSYAAIHGNGQINYGTSTYFNEAHGINSHTYLYPASGSASSAIIQNVSDGVAYGNYTAHGGSSGWSDPSFEISDIPGLQNYGKYPLLVGNCCLTSTYNTNCFGEELLRAQDKGAIGYIGASNSTYWDEDFYFGVGVGPIVLNPTYESTTLGSYDRAFHDHGEAFEDWFTTQSQMFFAGNLAVTESGSSRITYYWQIYCLMGDPSLMVYFGVPEPMNVTYEALMPLQSDAFTVNAEPYAYVAISKDGVLYGSALADETGVAVVALDPISVPGNADVIVTAQNKQPYIGTVLVASPEGPYVLLQSQVVNDLNGNNNQLPEYNESFGFNMELKNVGNSAAENLTVTLTTSSPYVEVKEGSETWPDIGPGETISLEYAFEVVTSMWLPDQHPAVFELTITDGVETWFTSFTTKLNAPLLAAGDLIIDDFMQGTGNGNRRLDPGENVVLSIPVNNQGHCAAPQALSHLFTESEWLDIDLIQYQIGDIETGATRNAVYQVAVSPDIPLGTTVDLYFTNAAGVYNSTRIYNPKVGLIIEDFETGDFSAYPWNNTSSLPWTITTTSVNGGTYAARSGAIGHNASTTLQITMNVQSNDEISFARRVSSESGYDFLKFYIDNSEKGSWSGNEQWATVSYPVTPGQHTFKWTYSKDGSATGGSDAVFIDDINFPSSNGSGQGTALAVKAFAYPSSFCGAGEANLFAFVANASGQVQYNWSPAGLLSSPDAFNPVAVFSESTDFIVNIVNLLYAASDTLQIPVFDIPPTPTIEQFSAQLISSAPEGNQWYNSQGIIEGAVNQIYEPLVADYYHVIVTSAAGCISAPSEEFYFSGVGVESFKAAGEMTVYPVPFRNQLNISFNLPKAGQTKISLLNLLGQEIQTITEGTLNQGNHSLVFYPYGLKPGIYFLKLQANDKTSVRKVVFSE